jgi:chloramphenicol 3-O-phosphotransferase
MTDMIEQVAQAILAKDTESLFSIHYARVYAKAAIAAMRDCTPAMLDAGSAAHPAGGYRRETLLNDIIECEWIAMVDAALGEK